MSCSKTPPELAAYVKDSLPAGVKPTLDVELGGAVELLAAQVTPSEGLKASSHVELTLYWRRTGSVPAGYRLFTSVIDGAGERLLALDTTGPLRQLKLGDPLLSPSDWKKGKVYVDKLAFFVPTSISTDSLSIVCGLARDSERLPVTRGPAGGPKDRAVVATLQVERAPRPPVSSPVIWLPRRLVTSPIVIDGKLDEVSWDRSAQTGPFTDAATGWPIAASGVSGSARLLYDERSLYVGFEVFDPNVQSGKDGAVLVIDPDGEGDNRDYYELQIGPKNDVIDSAHETHSTPADDTWSSQVESAVSIDGTLDDAREDVGFTAELAIPWAAFTRAKRLPPTLDDTWRLNLLAMKDARAVAAWVPILGQDYQQGARLGRVRFASAPNPRGTPVQALPSAFRPQTAPPLPPLPTAMRH